MLGLSRAPAPAVSSVGTRPARRPHGRALPTPTGSDGRSRRPTDGLGAGRSLLLGASLVGSLACSAQPRDPATTPTPGGSRIVPEILLPIRGVEIPGKILALTDAEVTFLPSPYWTTTPRTVPLAEIPRIRVRREGRGGKGFLYGFAAGFTVAGLAGGSSAEYKEDYNGALGSALGVGLTTGLIGWLVAASSGTTSYDLRGMTPEARRRLLLQFTVQREPAPSREGTWP